MAKRFISAPQRDDKPSYCRMVDFLIYVLWMDLKVIDDETLDDTISAIIDKNTL